MRIRQEIIVIAAFILIILLFVKSTEFFKVNVEEGDASNFVLEDLHSTYPAADIEIMTLTENQNDAGEKYFEVKAKVTKSPDSPCPRRSHIFYTYPAQNFVPAPPEVITDECSVCNEGICTIAFPEEAVIASHYLEGTEIVNSFLNLYSDAVPSVSEHENTWSVEWSSKETDLYLVVGIHRNGTIIGVDALGS